MIAQAQFTIADLNDGASVEVIVGTQTAATNVWTGRASFSALKGGQTILYWLPFAGTSTAATLNLTLSEGTTTGAKNVYINGTTRCTTHVAVGNVTQMTYRVNTPINGSGSYTGQPRPVLMSAVRQRELPELKTIVREIDPDAFVILLPAHQVLGEGFRRAGDEL